MAENKAMDTSENIVYSLELIDHVHTGSDKLKIGMVTNNYHLFRGVHLAKKYTDNNGQPDVDLNKYVAGMITKQAMKGLS